MDGKDIEDGDGKEAASDANDTPAVGRRQTRAASRAPRVARRWTPTTARASKGDHRGARGGAGVVSRHRSRPTRGDESGD